MGKTEVRGVQIKDTDITVSDIADGAVTEAKLGLANVTTGNSSTAKHGLLPKLPTPTGLFLKDDGTWDNASGGADDVVLSSSGVTLVFTDSSNPTRAIQWKTGSVTPSTIVSTTDAADVTTNLSLSVQGIATHQTADLNLVARNYTGANVASMYLEGNLSGSYIGMFADYIDINAVNIPLISGVPMVTTTAAQALTNKEIVPRFLSGASYTTHTPPIDTYDCFDITAQSAAIAFANPTGTPANFRKLIIRIKDNGTVRAISWGTSYVAGGVSLPTATVASKITTLGFIYSTAVAKWLLVALATQA